MWRIPEGRIWDYVIACKGCRENIPAPVETMPDQYFVAVCPLCGERRHYLPAELFRGRLSHLVGKTRQRRSGEDETGRSSLS
jgi:hypothetical protein